MQPYHSLLRVLLIAIIGVMQPPFLLAETFSVSVQDSSGVHDLRRSDPLINVEKEGENTRLTYLFIGAPEDMKWKAPISFRVAGVSNPNLVIYLVRLMKDPSTGALAIHATKNENETFVFSAMQIVPVSVSLHNEYLLVEPNTLLDNEPYCLLLENHEDAAKFSMYPFSVAVVPEKPVAISVVNEQPRQHASRSASSNEKQRIDTVSPFELSTSLVVSSAATLLAAPASFRLGLGPRLPPLRPYIGVGFIVATLSELTTTLFPTRNVGLSTIIQFGIQIDLSKPRLHRITWRLSPEIEFGNITVYMGDGNPSVGAHTLGINLVFGGAWWITDSTNVGFDAGISFAASSWHVENLFVPLGAERYMGQPYARVYCAFSVIK